MEHLTEEHISFLQDILSPIIVEKLEQSQSLLGLTVEHIPHVREMIRELLSHQDKEWGVHTLFSRPDLFKDPPELNMANLIICMFVAVGKGTPDSLHPVLLSGEGFALMSGLFTPFLTNIFLSSSRADLDTFFREWATLVEAGILERLVDGFLAKDVLDFVDTTDFNRHLNVLPL